MTDKQPEALRLADELEMWTLGEPAAAELRRLHAENEALRDGKAFHEVACRAALMENRALRQANEAFGKRQEWWNERMFALEKHRDELLAALEDVMDRLVDRHEADEAAVAARATIAKVKGEKK